MLPIRLAHAGRKLNIRLLRAATVQAQCRTSPRMTGLPIEFQQLIEDELAQREFMPVIQRIKHVSSFATPSTWEVETDRGNTQLVLKAEDQIWRLAHTSLLITDSYGVNFLIRDSDQLDKHSRKLLDRFL